VDFITFLITDSIVVAQYAARDEMHPTRVVLDTYVIEDGIESHAGHDHFAYALTLTAESARSIAGAHVARKSRAFATPAQRRAARLAAR
jgi:hypothetical protein